MNEALLERYLGNSHVRRHYRTITRHKLILDRRSTNAYCRSHCANYTLEGLFLQSNIFTVIHWIDNLCCMSTAAIVHIKEDRQYIQGKTGVCNMEVNCCSLYSTLDAQEEKWV